MKEDIKKLVDVELGKSLLKHGPFHGTYEGWAVIRKEFIELMQDCTEVGKHIDILDQYVRKNALPFKSAKAEEVEDFDPVGMIYEYAMQAAMEAIQVAAMAKHYKMQLIK